MLQPAVVRIVAILSAALVLLSCTSTRPQGSAPASGEPGAAAANPPREKTIVVGIRSDIQGFSLMAGDTTAGGWQSAQEIAAMGLITSDRDSRNPVPRIASKVPNFDDQSIQILPDGRMKTIYPLRKDVTWHDGAPFTAADLMFSFELAMDGSVSKPALTAISQMDSAEAPDEYTFVVYWKRPYYQADALGLRAFWPVPKHLLDEPYRTLDRLAFSNLPYWTSDFIHVGPFRVQEFRPGEGVTFAAYDRYFLGKPKVDRIIARIYMDANAVYAATLAGAVDVLMENTLVTENAFELADVWEKNGGGKIYFAPGSTRFIAPQFDPALQHTSALLDARVRTALTYALDRRAISEVVQHGHAELVADALLPPGDRLYDAVKDGLAQFAQDQNRARAGLGDAGWKAGPDGIAVGPGGTRLTIPLWVTEGSEKEIAVIGDYWKQVGAEPELNMIPGPLVRDRQFRQAYSGIEVSAAGDGDSILIRIDSRESTVPPNFFGNNRGHYVSPTLDGLIDKYRASVNRTDQAEAMKGLSAFIAEELPVMPLYYGVGTPGVRAGFKALDDWKGGAASAQIYGTYTRNAHEWDVL